MDPGSEQADERFREWMRGNLSRAAGHFGVTVSGEPVFGWRLRSIGAAVTGRDGSRWLRVVSEYPEWACDEWWTGNVDANVLTGVAKSRVLDTTEWEGKVRRRQRAELRTLAASPACAPQRELRQELALPDVWWATLRESLDALAVQPTTRTRVDREQLARQIPALTGIEVDLETVSWTTAHGDLHWANLTGPELTILDWEYWGSAPAGYDAALLYCTALLQPDTAARVHATFADVFDTPSGAVAQLAVVVRLLLFVEQGYLLDLAEPLHRHAREIARHIS